MKSIPPLKAVMTPFPYCIDIGARVEEARCMMQEHQIRHLPVMHDTRLVSVLTDRDLMLATDPALVSRAADVLVRDLCTRQAYVVELNQPLDFVLEHMSATHQDCALVTKEDRLVGIFTTTDACLSFSRLLRTLFPRSGNDDAA